MRLTRAGEYAIRCIYYLATRAPDERISRREIATAMEIPEPFLGKVAQQLARAGLIEIFQGSKGGFRLRRTPADISLLEVIEAVMGELYLNDCLIHPGACRRSPHCAIHDVWQTARRQLRETLAKADFEQLTTSGTGNILTHLKID